MRIVHVSTVHNPYDTRILYRECASLASAGHDVRLLVCCGESKSICGVTLIPIFQPKSRLARMTTTAYDAYTKIRALKPDVVHFHDPELILWMFWLKRRIRRIVFDVHEDIIANIEERHWIPRISVPLVRVVTSVVLRTMLRRFHVVFAEDSYVARYPLARHYAIVHNFPRLDTFPPPGASTKRPNFTIAYFGSISAQRGVTDLLDAAAILQRRGLAVALLLIGRDDFGDGESLRDKVAKRDLRNVSVMGYTRQPDALREIASCHVGFAVLREKPNFVESYPTKLFEYMGCGLAVLTSNFPLYRGVVEKYGCGMCIEPASPAAIANALEALMAAPELVNEMSKKGRYAVEREFNWDREERRLLDFYTEMEKQVVP